MCILRELIDQKVTESERRNGLVRKSEFACCENGRRVTVPTRRFFLTMQLVAKGSTDSVASLAPLRSENLLLLTR